MVRSPRKPAPPGSHSRPRNSRARRCRARRGRRALSSGPPPASTTEKMPLEPEKSRFQSAWSGMAFERRVQHARHAWLAFQPARRCRARSAGAAPAARPSCAGRAAPGRRRRARRSSPSVMKVSCSFSQQAVVGRDGAEQHVGMAGRIFRRGVDRDVDAMVERAEIERRRPGVVHHDDRAACMRGLGDRRNVLHLERVGARRFGEHDLGVRLHQRGDAGADMRVVILDLDAEPLQHRVGEIAGRDDRPKSTISRWSPADRKAEQRHGDRRQARRDDDRAGRAFQRVDRLGQRVGGRRAARAVGVFLLRAAIVAAFGKSTVEACTTGGLTKPK